MTKLFSLLKQRIYSPIWSLVVIPLWTVKKLNVWKFIGVSLLLWSVQILEKNQNGDCPLIGKKILIFWTIMVVGIACGFINNSSKD